MYLPLNVKHEADFCGKVNHGSCSADCGLGWAQQNYFQRNKWHKVRQNIKLNNPGKNDGVIQVWVNGEKKAFYSKMNYRTKESVGIEGFTVHPFFGGGESMKTPVDTYTLYKNFKVTTV